MKNVAIVCGAGRGERFGGDKVFTTLWGKPIFYWSLRAFEEHPEIDEIVAVVRAESIQRMKEFCKRYNFKKVRHVISGGETRMESVRKGLQAVEDDCLVLIHDAARPALTKGLISRVLHAYSDNIDGVVPIIRPVDTVKETIDSLVKKTLNRSNLALVQTPQVFLASTLKRAYSVVKEIVPDDASAVEASGGTIVTVQGEPFNIKITIKEDLLILEALRRHLCQNSERTL